MLCVCVCVCVCLMIQCCQVQLSKRPNDIITLVEFFLNIRLFAHQPVKSKSLEWNLTEVPAVELEKTYLIVLPPLFISLYTTWIPEWIKGLLKATQDSIRIETDPRSRQGERMAQFSWIIMIFWNTLPERCSSSAGPATFSHELSTQFDSY